MKIDNVLDVFRLHVKDKLDLRINEFLRDDPDIRVICVPDSAPWLERFTVERMITLDHLELDSLDFLVDHFVEHAFEKVTDEFMKIDADRNQLLLGGSRMDVEYAIDVLAIRIRYLVLFGEQKAVEMEDLINTLHATQSRTTNPPTTKGP